MKSYSDSTLMRMTKKELIHYVRICEHNQMVAQETLDEQYKNVLPIIKDINNSIKCDSLPEPKWILNDLIAPGIFCSNCGEISRYQVDPGPVYCDPHVDREVKVTYFMSEWCPHCGKLMR